MINAWRIEMSSFDKKLREKLELSEKDYEKLKKEISTADWSKGSMNSVYEPILKAFGLDWKKMKGGTKQHLDQLRRNLKKANLKEGASRLESLGLMRRFEGMYGNNTANYYKAILNALYNKQVTPASVVGGGLKDGRGVAEKWLKKRIEEAEREGNIGQGNVTVSKPAKPTYSETDGYFYFVKNNRTKSLLWFGWTPSQRGADRASNRARQLATSLISYGNHYSDDDLQEKLNSNKKLSKLPAEKKSIATKEYDEYQVTSGYSSASSVGSYDTKGLVDRFSTEHLTRKELKLFANFVKLVKTTKRGSETSLRSKIVRLAYDKPTLRDELLPLLNYAYHSDTKKASAQDLIFAEARGRDGLIKIDSLETYTLAQVEQLMSLAAWKGSSVQKPIDWILIKVEEFAKKLNDGTARKGDMKLEKDYVHIVEGKKGLIIRLGNFYKMQNNRLISVKPRPNVSDENTVARQKIADDALDYLKPYIVFK